MNHTHLQSAVSIESLAMLSRVISKHGDDDTLKALAGILAEMGKPKTAQAVLAARREALAETPNPKNLPPLPLQWWVFAVDIVGLRNDRVEESGFVYVRHCSMNGARHVAETHARVTWSTLLLDGPQRIDVAALGTAKDTSPLFVKRHENVFTLGVRAD